MSDALDRLAGLERRPGSPLRAAGASTGTLGRRVDLAVPVQLRAGDLEPVPDAAGPPVMVEGLAVPWETPVPYGPYGDTLAFARSSLRWADPNRVKFLVDHGNHAIGYAVELRDTPAGLEAVMAIPRAQLGYPDSARVIDDMTSGIRDALSVGVDVLEADAVEADDGTTAFTVTAGQLLELSSCVLPRYDDARVASIAAQRPPNGETTMTVTIPARVAASDVPPDPAPEPDPVPEPDPDSDGGEAGERDRLEAARAGAGTRVIRAAMPDRYGSLGAYAIACAAGQVPEVERRRIGMALTDLTTEGIPGLVPPQWVSGFADQLNNARPVVSAFSSIALPNVGMTMTWPVRTRTPPLTGEQLTEKVEVESGTVAYTTANSDVRTWAGANDIAIQAIERSDPSLASLLLQELTYDLAYNTDAAFAADLNAKATGAPVTVDSPADINASLAEAAGNVLSARYGAVPDVFLLGTDAWVYMAGAADADGRPLFPNINGANPVGTLSLTDDGGSARGLTVVMSPDIAPNTALVAWSGAATSAWSAVRTMTADQPAILGRDVAIYQYGTWMVRRPEAIVKLTLPVIPFASSGSSGSSGGKGKG